MAVLGLLPLGASLLLTSPESPGAAGCLLWGRLARQNFDKLVLGTSLRKNISTLEGEASERSRENE